ncbi:MAG: flagellar export chaperone FlgN [Ilumatobacter sp.]
MDIFDELTRRLMLLHDQMEQLVCALDIQQLVLANNRLRWLPAVTENVEVLVDEIKISELDRLAVTREAAASLGVDGDQTLAQLADAAGEPFRAPWRRIRLQLVSLHHEIEQITASSAQLGRHGAMAANEVITTLGGADTMPAYSATGRTEPVNPATHRFDRTV